jgi:hypothetical protein
MDVDPLVLLACWKLTPFRAWALNVDLRWLVLFHPTRLFAGSYFLVLWRRGELPGAFVVPAGWGDIVIAVLALGAVGAMRTQIAKAFLLLWNTLRLIDIVFVVFSALRFGMKDWQSMRALRNFPLSLFPDISGVAYHRVTRLDFRPAGANANWFVVNDLAKIGQLGGVTS